MNSRQEATAVPSDAETGTVPKTPFWLRATLDDLAGLDFEAPIASATSADCRELSQLFQAAQGTPTENGDPPDTPAARVLADKLPYCGVRYAF